VATQDPNLRREFTGAADPSSTNARFIDPGGARKRWQLGFRNLEEMVGRRPDNKLEIRQAIVPLQGRRDLRFQFDPAQTAGPAPQVGRYCTIPQEHQRLEKAIDNTREPMCRRRGAGRASRAGREDPATSIGVVGTIVGSRGERVVTAVEGLPEDTIKLKFSGSVGPEFRGVRAGA